MAFTITSAIPVSAKLALLKGEMLAANTYKIGLFCANADLTVTYSATAPSTNTYTALTTATDELPTAGGYTANGKTLATYQTKADGTTACLDWDTDPAWTSATFVTAGAFLYNSTSGQILATFDFGGDKSVTAGTFSIVFPAYDASNALIRLT